MKANELRLNNWVQYKTTYSTGYGEIRSLEYGRMIKVLANEDILTLFMPDLSPIELTPEILEKCGISNKFYDNKFEYYLDLSFCDMPVNDIVFTFYNNEYKCLIRSGDTTVNANGIKYLHQLQNLYFALTGEELNINL